MLRIALCDDVPICIEEIRNLLNQWDEKPAVFHIDSFDSGESLLQSHNTMPYDIIFLDVIMSSLNGIETAKIIRQTDKMVRIVFISSERSFAVDSYVVKADNYLLKPIVAKDFYTCMQELCTELYAQSKRLTIRTATATYRIEINNIEYFEAQNKIVLIYLTDGRILHANHALYTFEEQLGYQDGFYKCHRSYLVNINHIHAYTAKYIQLRSGTQIPISRNCHKDFENTYFDFLFGRAGEH